MNMQSRILCKSYGYTAAIAGYKVHGGPILSVTRELPGGTKGKYVKGAEAAQWAEAIETSIDAGEQAALCRAIYNN